MDNYDETNMNGGDCEGHGTHVASLAVGKTYGVAKKATVYSVRVLNCIGVGPWSVIIDGINYAARHASENNHCSVISMSLSGPYMWTANAAISKVVNEMGIPVVVSAGNSQGDACYRSPSSTPEAITVGATNQNDELYLYSNGGSCVDIFAPGDDIEAASHECSNCTTTMSGTSMSTPLVAGAVATVLELEPSLTPAKILQYLTDVATKDAIDLSPLSSSSIMKETPNRLLFTKGTCNMSCITRRGK